MGLFAKQCVQKCMAFKSSGFRMTQRFAYEITYEDIEDGIVTFKAYSPKSGNLIQVAKGWDYNYACKRIIKIEELASD